MPESGPAPSSAEPAAPALKTSRAADAAMPPPEARVTSTVGTAAASEYVEWQSDAPTRRDVLRRDALAWTIAERLRQRTADEPTFLMLLDGPWGSGKTSVLRMTQAHLARHGWATVSYDAWRQSRVGASWWSLLSTVRQHVLACTPTWRRLGLRLRELWHQRLARTPTVLALCLVFAVALGLFLLLRPGRFDLTSVGSTVQTTAAGLTAAATLWAGAVATARFMLWQSTRSARFFEQHTDNPIEQVARHFGWLIQQLSKPMLLVIDDLDRCRPGQVVELLESIQTLLRDAPPPDPDRPLQPVAVVVAADAAWLHQAYEREYAGLGPAVAEPGKPLGYLFCDKIFQLVVPMPGLGEARQAAFLASLLGAASAEPSAPVDATAVRDAVRRIEASGSEAEVLAALSEVAPQVREQVAPEAVTALGRPEVAQASEHALTRFASLLPANPRAMKRFLNDYSVARVVRTLEGDPVPTDALAQWTIIRIRWPALAGFLARKPEVVADAAPPDGVPPGLAALLGDEDVRRVLSFPAGATLTPELIRRCYGGHAPPEVASDDRGRRP